jgi:addiction module HigA family antidote
VTDRPPIHPGDILLEEFLKPLGVTQRDLAAAIDVPFQRINEIVNGRRGVTPSSAVRLAQFLGTSGAFWMNAQVAWDLYHAQKSEASALKRIRPHPTAPQRKRV